MFDKLSQVIKIALCALYMEIVMSKSNRSIFRFVSKPKEQLKYAFLNALFISGFILLTNIIVMIKVRSMEDINSEFSSLVFSISDLLLQLGLISFLSSFIITFFSTIIITHRFFGPTISIDRYIDSLINKKFDASLSLRSTDEMHDIANKLVALGNELKKTQK